MPSIKKQGSPQGVVANVLDCDIVVSLNSVHTNAVPFELIPTGKV